MSERPLYTQQQLQEYFGYVGFSKGDQDVIAGNGNIADRLESLARLIRMQMSNIPFENLDIHYSNHHSVSLDVGHLYDKFVRRKDGRGGYCMENNTFFGTVLRSLGFDVMACGGRVTDVAAAMKPHAKSSSVSFRSWGHMVNIVTIADERYLIDVGFGNNAPTFAVPLMDGFTSLNTGNENGGSYLRLTREHIPDNTHRGTAQLLW
ncbi:Hypothetical protein D9617_28g065100 [Elsinoe fawcettii]|nr:Hypothetical protein D9617_28g065100 [Elsinoe fawcettii]